MPAYRVGIVGCGARSTAHAAGWVANDGVAIAAVADPIQERRDTLGDKHGVAQAQRYPDFKDMLGASATRLHLHFDQARTTGTGCRGRGGGRHQGYLV